MKKVLVIGAGGQIGTELVLALEKKYGKKSIIASDLKEKCPKALEQSNYSVLNVLDKKRLESLIVEEQITDVYLLAALLSATAEKKPKLGWDLNMNSLLNVLELAREGKIKRIFWPSSIAVFGPTTPKDNTPQNTIMEPTTVYGISKLAGERWCEYYSKRYGIDVRSIRYPGLISYTVLPGGGTTDYAVDAFYYAKAGKKYTSFVRENTSLPMLYMEDAIRGTIELMEADKSSIKIGTSYNLGGVNFTAEKLMEKIKQSISHFEVEYLPDYRQDIADTWPRSINDNEARSDWNWEVNYDINKLVETMLQNVNPKLLFKEED